MKTFLTLLSIITLSACCGGLSGNECSCTLKAIKLDFNAHLQDMQGKPLKIKGAELFVKENSANVPISSEKPLISDSEGKITGKIIIGERDNEAPGASIVFTYPKIDGYYFSNSDLYLDGFGENYTLKGSAITYAKRNYLKLTITSLDSLVSKFYFHSHIGNGYLLNLHYIIAEDDYLHVDFKKGMTQTIVVPSVRDANSFFHFDIYDYSNPVKKLKNTVTINSTNPKNLGDFIFPPMDKDTVSYTLIINK